MTRVVLVALSLLVAGGALAAEPAAPTAPAAGGAAPGSAEPAPPSPPKPTVAISEVVVLDGGGAVRVPPRDFTLGDVIEVKLAPGGLAALQAQALARNNKAGLFLDGHFQVDIPLVAMGTDIVTFEPVRSDANKAFWNGVLGGRFFAPRDLTVAVGLQEGSLVVPATQPLTLRPLHDAKGWLLIAASALLGALTIWWGSRRGMCRDAGEPADGKLATYSLGRSQMAFWFVNIAIAVLVIWAITGAIPPLTTSVLALMGIGSGTALGAALIDQGAGGSPPTSTKGFRDDILTDGGKIALHRFQMLVWTLVLWCVFVGDVYTHLALPDFDTTLLALVGISAGTYVGFKFPENQAAAAGSARG